MGDEADARERINGRLEQSGWPELDNPAADATGYRTEVGSGTGPCDYLLQYRGEPIAVVEAKKAGGSMPGALDQGARYAREIESEYGSTHGLDFVIASDGDVIRLRDRREEAPSERPLSFFHKPEGLHKLSKVDYSRAKQYLNNKSVSDTDPDLWTHQTECLQAIEAEWKKNKRGTLIQMATGSGKTRMAAAHIYRMLRSGYARKILFIPDTRNLANQALSDISSFRTASGHELQDEFAVTNLESNSEKTTIEEAQVVVTTLQKMYALLEDDSTQLEPHLFDFIVTDECHRSIYKNDGYGAVLERFDALELGLTATPSKNTIRRFGDPKYEYGYQKALDDGHLADYRLQRIETRITMDGVTDPEDGQLYPPDALGTRVNVPDTYRTIGQRIYQDVDEEELTLIFTSNEAHAREVTKALREVFSEYGDDYVAQISSEVRDADRLIDRFSQLYKNPRIAVSVGMLTTGIDIRPLSNIVLLRPTKSPVLYNQMMGRGTRTYTGKPFFTIYDCVGASEYFAEHGNPPFDTKTYESKQKNSQTDTDDPSSTDEPITVDARDEIVRDNAHFPTAEDELIDENRYVDRFEKLVTNTTSNTALSAILDDETMASPEQKETVQTWLAKQPEYFTVEKLRHAYGIENTDIVDFIHAAVLNNTFPTSRGERVKAAFNSLHRSNSWTETQEPWIEQFETVFYHQGESVSKSDFAYQPLAGLGGWKRAAEAFGGAEELESLIGHIDRLVINTNDHLTPD
jgi:type I restriction enzyme R subunit